MYKISDFARLTGVTPKTLRFYEAQGLLIPSYVDRFSSYRYYESEQIKELSMILQLKQVGFSLNEIKAFQNNALTFNQKLETLEERKLLLENVMRLLRFQTTETFAYSAYFKEEKALRVAAKQVFVSDFHELIAAYPTFYNDTVGTHITLLNPEYCAIEYLDGDYRETDLSANLYLGITDACPCACAKVLPPSKYVATIHRGSYDTVNAAYAFLEKYIDLQRLEVVGNPSERYYESYYSRDNEQNYLTEIRFPIKSMPKILCDGYQAFNA